MLIQGKPIHCQPEDKNEQICSQDTARAFSEKKNVLNLHSETS